MSRFTTAAALACLGLMLAGPANAAREEPVAVIVADHVAPELARAIKRQASQGKAALIRYLERGRFTYVVRVESVVVNTR
jgi:hypothetical protein